MLRVLGAALAAIGVGVMLLDLKLHPNLHPLGYAGAGMGLIGFVLIVLAPTKKG